MKSASSTAPVFSSFKAAMAAALGGWMAVTAYSLYLHLLERQYWHGWGWDQNMIDCATGVPIFFVIGVVVFWPWAAALKRRPILWQPMWACTLGGLGGGLFFLLVSGISSGFEYHYMEYQQYVTEPYEAMTHSFCGGALIGVGSCFAASCYYRKTHPPQVHDTEQPQFE